ncbi:hypothetical protein C9993_04475 [Marinobacter sp. Z-F4-2]|nr:hypothetical protein C9993_04475 [Marinobacter sp. Z-F4-2]
MKYISLLFAAALLTGCANHATFKTPSPYTSIDDEFTGQTVKYTLKYSQPEPGIFTGGQQQVPTDLSKSNLSIVSAHTLANAEEIVERHLPAGLTPVTGESGADYLFDVQMTAHSKHGPTAWDFQFAKSLGIGLLTLGLGPDYWQIIADYKVTYSLTDSQTGHTITEEYAVTEVAEHQAGPFESNAPLKRASRDMFERNFALTLNEFFEQVDTLAMNNGE